MAPVVDAVSRGADCHHCHVLQQKEQVYFTLRQRCVSSSRVLTEDLSEDLAGTGAGLYQ